MTAQYAGTVEQLLAEREITAVLHAYCQGVDRRDWDRVRSCYHEEAVDQHGAFIGNRDELVEWLSRRHASAVTNSVHQLTNVAVRFHDDGHLARVESYCLSMQLVVPVAGDPFAGRSDEQVFTQVMSRYVDTFEFRPTTGWRILRRDCVFDWMQRKTTDEFVPIDPTWVLARRDSEDLLYAKWPVAAGSARSD